MTKKKIKELQKAIEYLDKVEKYMIEAISDQETESDYIPTLAKVGKSSSDNKELLEAIISEA